MRSARVKRSTLYFPSVGVGGVGVGIGGCIEVRQSKIYSQTTRFRDSRAPESSRVLVLSFFLSVNPG